MANEHNCILRDLCKLAGTDACTSLCPHFVAMHGASGHGGRVGESVPVEYRKFTVADNPIRDAQPDAFKKLDAYKRSFSRMFDEARTPSEQIKNAYLWSEAPGTGKTATACAVANDFQALYYVGALKRGLYPDNAPVFFLDVAEFQTLFNRFSRPNASGEQAERANDQYYRMMDAAKLARLAVMDDIGARSATEAFRGDLHAVINYRYTKRLPTVFTSNIPIHELTDVFDRKLMDRVRDLTIEVEYQGESKRGRRV